jgi:hypothetical protein
VWELNESYIFHNKKLEQNLPVIHQRPTKIVKAVVSYYIWPSANTRDDEDRVGYLTNDFAAGNLIGA